MIVGRALIAVVLLLNGLVIQPAAAFNASAPATGEASHMHHAMGEAGDDCCETTACDCGCAISQAATLPVTMPRTSCQVAPPAFGLAARHFHTRPLSTPFRPPA